MMNQTNKKEDSYKNREVNLSKDRHTLLFVKRELGCGRGKTGKVLEKSYNNFTPS